MQCFLILCANRKDMYIVYTNSTIRFLRLSVQYSWNIRLFCLIRSYREVEQTNIKIGFCKGRRTNTGRLRGDFAFSCLASCLRCLELRRGTQIEDLQRGTVISHDEKTFAVLGRCKRWVPCSTLNLSDGRVERYNNLSGLFSPCI